MNPGAKNSAQSIGLDQSPPMNRRADKIEEITEFVNRTLIDG